MGLRLETLTLLRQCLYNVTLNVGASDFPETATAVLAARLDLDEAIKEATTEPWPGTVTPLTPSPAITEAPEE
jgi:hypothetical protein